MAQLPTTRESLLVRIRASIDGEARFDWAAKRIRGEFQESTWQAFWRTAVGGESPRDVGRDLGISTGAVYMAKSRVLMRFREEIEQSWLDVDDP